MTPTEATEALKFIDELFPKSEWTDTMRGVFADRLKPIDITTEQARAVVTEYRMNNRWRTPQPKDLIDRMRTAAGQRRREEVGAPPLERPFWHNLRAQMGLPRDAGLVEVYTNYHGALMRKEIDAGRSEERARDIAWGGLVTDLCRNGVEWDQAVYAATSAYGQARQEQIDHTAKLCARPKCAQEAI